MQGSSWPADLWDDVWTEYDGRRAARPAAPAAAPRRRRRPRWPALLAGLLALPAIAAAGPVLAMRDLLAALRQGDAAAVAERVDWDALRPALLDRLRADAGAGDAAGYLEGLTTEVAAGLATPAGLLRLLGAGSFAGRWEIRALHPEAPTRWRLGLAAPAVDAALTLDLQPVAGGWRWQVVAVDWPG